MKPLRLFSTDLDGTVVGDNDATRRFRDFWHSLPEAKRPLLVFNSGRLIDDQLALLEEVPLPQPDYIIGGVGTMLHAKSEANWKAPTHSPSAPVSTRGRLPRSWPEFPV